MVEGAKLPSEMLAEMPGKLRPGEGLHVTGHPKSGKTTAVDKALGGRARLRLKLPEAKLVDEHDNAVDPGSLDAKRDVIVLELPSSFQGVDVDGARNRVRDLEEKLRARAKLYVVEANGYVLEFLRSSDKFEGIEEMEKHPRDRNWVGESVGRLLGFAEFVKSGRGAVATQPPRDYFEVSYDEGQARRLARELATRKLGDGEVEKVLRYARVNHGLHKGRYFPGMIRRAVEDPSITRDESVKMWEEWEHAEDRMAAESGLLAGAAVVGEEAIRAVEGILPLVAHAATPIAIGVPILALGYLGWRGRKAGFVEEILRLRKAWHEMPEERKEYLAYQYDIAMRLVPGTSRGWLDDLFGIKEEELRNKLRSVEEYLDSLWRSLGGVVQLEGDAELRSYYGVPISERIAPSGPQERAVEELRRHLESAYAPGAPKVLVLTGPSGVGKSWAAYFLVSSLAREGESRGGGDRDVYKVDEMAVSGTLPREGSIPRWAAGRRPVMVLDDRHLGVRKGVVLTLDDLREKLRDAGRLGMPLVLSISRGNWEELETGLEGLDMYAEVVEIRRWDDDDVRELAQRISRELGIEFEEGALEELIKRSNGMPLAASIFLRNFASRNPGGGRVRMEDLEEIGSDLGEYVLDQLSRNYAQGLFTKSPEVECGSEDLSNRVVDVYRFLHAAAVLGGVPVGYVKCLSDRVSFLRAALIPGGYPPLFINDRGVLRPQHPSIAEPIEDVVRGDARRDGYLRCVGAILRGARGSGEGGTSDALLSGYIEDLRGCSERAIKDRELFGPYYLLSLLIGLRELEESAGIIWSETSRDLGKEAKGLMRILGDADVRGIVKESLGPAIAEEILYLMSLYVEDQGEGLPLLDYYGDIARDDRYLELLGNYAHHIGGWFPSIAQRKELAEQTLKIADKNYLFARGLGFGVGWSFGSMGDDLRRMALGIAERNEGFARGLGDGVGRSFGSMGDDLRREVLEFASRNEGFAIGLGGSVGVSFGSMGDDLRRMALGIAERNEGFARGLGIGVGESFGSMGDDLRREVLEFASRNEGFARGLGIGVGGSFRYLSDDIRREVLEFASRNEGFARWLGIGVGWSFRYLSDDIRREVLEFASRNEEFARGLGFGVGWSFGSMGDDLRREVLEFASRNEEFARGLGFGVGWSFGSMGDDLRREVLEFASRNEEFARGLGIGVGWSFRYLSDDIRREVLEFASRNEGFARGLRYAGVNVDSSKP
ncbi:hypothetical protein [Conexivisphaera calida]|uniref:Uncharacterized protein n=1 Tax=Conexivisphaera calida TaxID=1874277 RepID=A0A4P2VN82_9ARCH|nr:hypothetical protein [Conexivisphaera calida]BBE42418.1 hypothetical protein NAS2_1029 [Conexivisphaera calida]